MAERRCRLVVLISGGGSNLQALITATESWLAADIACVFSNRADAGGLVRAASAGIATELLSHRDYESREAFDTELARRIETYAPDLIVLAGFMRILSTGFVRRFHGQLLNIHPSLLPKYPGLDTHRRAIEAGDHEAGVTVHFVTEELDGGPPVVQARVPVLAEDTAASLAARVLVQEHRIYPLAVSWFATGRLRLQDHSACLDGAPLPPTGVLLNSD